MKPSAMRRLARIFFAGVGLVLLAIAVEVVLGWRCDLQGQTRPHIPQPEQRRSATEGIPGYARPEDDTYLSYPEWYIVWSYEEKGDFQQNHLPSGFPYFAAVRQYWNSYRCIIRLTKGKYPFNFGEQVMLVVIGTSFSAEYILKGAYENTLGRLSEWSSGHQPVEEDDYGYKVAREYADFVHIRPFYEFRFARHAAGVWSGTHLRGPHPLRKWERKLFLTLDYTIEAFYCWLIEKATHLTYGYEPADTYAWIENADEELFTQLPRTKKVKQVGSQAFIVDIPRYQEFTAVGSALSAHGARFVEIAGNSQITLSVVTPKLWKFEVQGPRPLFSAPVLTHPELKRVVIGCEVDTLHSLLNSLRMGGMVVEHVYDY